MTNIDKLYGAAKKNGVTRENPLDQLFRDEEENNYRQIRNMDAERIRLEREKQLA